MKKTFKFLITLVLLFGILSTAAFAEKVVFQHGFSAGTELPKSHGSWMVKGGRLYQDDVIEPMAKINIGAAQSGLMQYEFDVRYEDGGFDDLKGGFGIHVFVDKAHDGVSWGNGNSFLLWLNYDENATYGPSGFTGQVYKSTSPVEMELLGDFDLNMVLEYLSPEYMSYILKIRLKVDAKTGNVWIEDPTFPGYGYAFGLGGPLGEGNFVSFRTNSLSLSFDNIKITKLE